MSQRASLLLSLVLLSTSACTSSVSGESHIGERLERFTRRTKAEFLLMAERHELRERLRAEGARFCEEGDWPQRWGEGCDTCGCDVGDVLWCQKRHRCSPAVWVPIPERATSNANAEDAESQVGKRLEKLTRRTRGELEAKAYRHRERENFRAAGARVCEEGDWPQEWWEGCQWCWCNVGRVRDCESYEPCDPEVARKLRQLQDEARKAGP